ncbi:MAG TPA: DUF4231 domain-containing protein [Chitinophagaceae bacterium]|jgi:hypothetical protein|nr:DUF4231 domain-containing protein [Chitinophagaceae bacterium]
MKKIPLIREDRLTNVIDELKGVLTDKQITFLKNRWLHQVIYWDQRSRNARHKYFALRAIMVLGGVSVPVFTSLAMTYSTHTEFSVIATVLGALVAASAAWEGVANYGQIWLEKRRAAELLKVEGWLFFERADHYSTEDYDSGFTSFAASVENLIAKEIGEYVAVFDPAALKKRQKNFDKLIEAAVKQYITKQDTSSIQGESEDSSKKT